MSLNPVEHRCLLPVSPAGKKQPQTRRKTENAEPAGTVVCRVGAAASTALEIAALHRAHLI